MDIVLLLIIAAAGLRAVSSHTIYHRQYHLVKKSKNMTEAQRYCREKYTDLATVDGIESLKRLHNVGGKYRNSTWIGLYIDGWRWSLSDTNFYKPGETEFRGWSTHEPSHTLNKRCTMICTDRYWYSDYCSNHKKAACIDVKGPNVTFVQSDDTMNWTDAQSYCRKKYTDLASVRNLTDNQLLTDMTVAGGNTWIGLYRDSWKWSDGSYSTFRDWAGVEPQGVNMCVAAAFNIAGKWESLDCGLRKPFICYKNVVPVTMQVIKVRLRKTNSAVDPNDPAFQDEMLVKMKKELMDQRLDENSKLTWRKQPDGQVFLKEKEEKRKKRNYL
ncbi:macrophage mannose receptor 1-like isoform X2 [Eleginops maclovinus]|uniref:macrophage mannose receptor 1-like isoform X2 n=1 Tax=Eleginops maclovinus TaxID=56733 RepID=UPI003080F601